jgi:hypothetical protein
MGVPECHHWGEETKRKKKQLAGNKNKMREDNS